MDMILIIGLMVAVLIVSYYLTQPTRREFMDLNHSAVIKGLSIIFVILAHIGGKFHIYELKPLGGIGVTLFLICSGYGVSESFKQKRLKQFWTNKISKVWAPYFLIQTLAAVGFHQDLSIYLLDISLIDYEHPFGWFMQYIFLWYIVFYILYRNHRLSDKTRLAWLALFSFGTIFTPYQLWAEQAFSFLIGIALSTYKDSLNGEKLSKWWPVFLGGGWLFGLTQLYYPSEEIFWLTSNLQQIMLKTPFAIGVILMTYRYNFFLRNKLLHYIGEISFYLYLAHAYTLETLESPGLGDVIPFLGITLAAGICFDSVISYWQIPGQFKRLILSLKKQVRPFQLKQVFRSE